MTMSIAITPVEKLYPPARPEEITRLLSALGSGERDRDRKMLLPRALTPPERAALQKRRDVLKGWVTLGGNGGLAKIKAVVAQMLLGFASRNATIDEANAILSQYAFALRDIPTWAVERACMRFASNQVTAADLGAKVIDLTWGPSSAMIARVARSLFEPLHRELFAVNDVLAGVVASRAQTPEEREAGKAAIAGMLGAAKAAMAAGDLIEAQASARRQESTRERAAAQLEMRRQEYRDAGLEAPDGETFTSLPMMLRMGWTIQDSPRGRVLVRPRSAPAPERGPTRDNEMGS